MNQFSENVRKLRAAQSLTQDMLAEKSGLSIRTIQRIEAGEVKPRSESLIMLSNALGVSPAALADWTVKQDTAYIAILNFSSLCFLLFPVLGIILPLVLWVSKKDQIENLGRSARSVINFQITWNILLFIFIIYMAVSMVLSFDTIQATGDVTPSRVSGIIDPIISVYLGFCIYNIIFIMLNVILSAFGRKNFWFPAIPFMK